MKKLILLFSFLIFNCSLSIATIRYVSHEGSDTPPYLSWETAADSIMSAINISAFGDTIYVANGVYEEQVVMIPGLSLIGAGMDSCIISFQATGIAAVTVMDSCMLKGFQIIVPNTMNTWGIDGIGNSGFISDNQIINPSLGIYIHNSNIMVYNNVIKNIKTDGIMLHNSNSTVRQNTILTDPNSQASIPAGIYIDAFNNSYTPLIDSNIIYMTKLHAYSPTPTGIYKSVGSKPIIKNNAIFMDSLGGIGMALSYSDSTKIFNNLIFGRGDGIDNLEVQCLLAYNNYIGGEINIGIQGGPNNILKNNVITGAEIGIEKWMLYGPPAVKYNNLWNNTLNYSGFTADTTNISVNPMVINDDTTEGKFDFHLQMFSPLIDRGDPIILDKDGSRSDIGLYGGPYGESYKYLDLPPRTPVNFTAVLDTNIILLTWNRNTEADFGHYNLYRDTIQGFTIDSTTFVASIEDTFYLHIIPPGIRNLYFKLTAADNQENQSLPSEELHIFITGIKENGKLTIINYQLYQNYPNPFNPTTKIGYRLKERGYVKLYVYDIKGELVKILVNKYQEGGYYEVEFNGTKSGNPESGIWKLASGIYIYQIMVRNEQNIPVFSETKKMLMIK